MFSQVVEIHDPRFLHALFEAGVDRNGDSTISFREAARVRVLNVADKDIHDLTGIERFTNLVELDCSRNYLKSLDVTRNTSMEKLYCFINCLTDLNVSGNTSLTELSCDCNNLTELDVSKNNSLRFLSCDVNPLKILDLKSNRKLEILDCLDTRMQSLDLTNNRLLEILRCNFNPLNHLDVSRNLYLRYLECFCIGLNTLDVTSNRNLVYLGCNFNQLSYLDVSRNDSLQKLCCGVNRLVTLNVSGNADLKVLDVSGMEMLEEVCVRTLPFQPGGLKVYAERSPNIQFKDCRAPDISISEIKSGQDYVDVTSSENGVIYLVPENTDCELWKIRDNCIDSLIAVAHLPVRIPVPVRKHCNYLIYARDSSGNISVPGELTIESVGIEKMNDENIKIYPNPFDGQLRIATDSPANYNIEITSLGGRSLLNTTMAGPAYQLDLSSFQKGIYVITIRSEGSLTIRKIIKL
jgi:hypothetical protein